MTTLAMQTPREIMNVLPYHVFVSTSENKQPKEWHQPPNEKKNKFSA
jgi:hypothetical protein